MDEKPTHAQVERALRLINVGLLKQARVRQWCSDYEEFVKDINEQAGFEALGQRIHRRTTDLRLTLRMRGTISDNEQAVDDFHEYLMQFESAVGLEFGVEIASWGQSSDEEEANVLRRLYDDGGSLAVDGCNCVSCTTERARAVARVNRDPIIGVPGISG